MCTQHMMIDKFPIVLHCICSSYRERFPKNTWVTPIPQEAKLTDAELTAFVECLKPAVMLAVFHKSGSFDAAGALQNLALIKPDIVLPTLLDK